MLRTEAEKEKKGKAQKYFKCERCGYISIVNNPYCPVCAKDGKIIKMK